MMSENTTNNIKNNDTSVSVNELKKTASATGRACARIRTKEMVPCVK